MLEIFLPALEQLLPCRHLSFCHFPTFVIWSPAPPSLDSQLLSIKSHTETKSHFLTLCVLHEEKKVVCLSFLLSTSVTLPYVTVGWDILTKNTTTQAQCNWFSFDGLLVSPLGLFGSTFRIKCWEQKSVNCESPLSTRSFFKISMLIPATLHEILHLSLLLFVYFSWNLLSVDRLERKHKDPHWVQKKQKDIIENDIFRHLPSSIVRDFCQCFSSG